MFLEKFDLYQPFTSRDDFRNEEKKLVNDK